MILRALIIHRNHQFWNRLGFQNISGHDNDNDDDICGEALFATTSPTSTCGWTGRGEESVCNRWAKKTMMFWGRQLRQPVYMGVSEIGVPQNGWFIMENPIKTGWFGGTTIFGNTHIYIYIYIYLYIYIFIVLYIAWGRQNLHFQRFVWFISWFLGYFSWFWGLMGNKLNH